MNIEQIVGQTVDQNYAAGPDQLKKALCDALEKGGASGAPAEETADAAREAVKAEVKAGTDASKLGSE